MSTQNGCQSERVIQSCALESSVYPHCKSIREESFGVCGFSFIQSEYRSVSWLPV